MEQTTREQIADRLRERPQSPSAIGREFGVGADEAVAAVRHVARSVAAADEQLLVAPPACQDCGFDRFDEPASRPSRCPDCYSEAITEPVFRVETNDV
jgi:Predicted transcriptional regulator containing an HTH domain fused to a Zn-ribbon